MKATIIIIACLVASLITYYFAFQKGFEQGGNFACRSLDATITAKGYIGLYDFEGNFLGIIKTNKDVPDFNTRGEK